MKDFKSYFKDVDTSVKYDDAELQTGIKVEMEHTLDKEIATTIAKQHLAEDPHYYTKLAKIHADK